MLSAPGEAVAKQIETMAASRGLNLINEQI
jgi:hypothetical protein